MSRLNDVLTALATAVNDALNNAGLTTPNQVGIGKPNYEDLTKIITAEETQVAIFTDDSGIREEPGWQPRWMVKTPANVTLAAAVSGGTITFSGTIPASGSQFNVHTLVGAPLENTLYQTVPGDTPATVATAVATLINGLGLSGVSASASGDVVTVTGSSYVRCNIGGSATLARAVLRVSRLVEVICYAPDPDVRAAMEHAIVSSVGTKKTRRLPLADGTNVVCFYHTNAWVDDKEQDFSMYESHLFYTLKYDVLQTQTATQIGAFKTTLGNLDTGVNQAPSYEG